MPHNPQGPRLVIVDDHVPLMDTFHFPISLHLADGREDGRLEELIQQAIGVVEHGSPAPAHERRGSGCHRQAMPHAAGIGPWAPGAERGANAISVDGCSVDQAWRFCLCIRSLWKASNSVACSVSGN